MYGSSNYFANNTFEKYGNTPGGRLGFAVPESSPFFANQHVDVEGNETGDLDMTQDKSALMSSFITSPRGLKRSRNGQIREQVESEYPGIARALTTRAGPAKLEESDDMLLQEEEILSQLDKVAVASPHDRDLAVGERVRELLKLFLQHGDMATKEAGVGPEAGDGLSKASYLASLLLQLHHPCATQSVHVSRRQRSDATATNIHNYVSSTPRALLDWLDTYHNPFPDEFDMIWRSRPSPAAHERFWDCIFSCLARGKLDRAIRLLSTAGWENAATAVEDRGLSGGMYSDRQLDSIEEVVERCIEVLHSCPGLKNNEWDIKGGEWLSFRRRVRQAVKDLEAFAGENEELGESTVEGNMFAKSSGMGMSSASRKAESKVPWSIYENLKLAYGILLGNTDEIVDVSQDWLEASLYLTVWWDGESETVAPPMNASQSLRKSVQRNIQNTREIDVVPSTAYRKRLAEAFLLVTNSEDPVFVPISTDIVHLGLACIMLGSSEGIVGILTATSLPVAVAVVDVAALGGWLTQRSHSTGLLEQGFDSEDLMVLSHGSGQNTHFGGVERDTLLSTYADQLAEKSVLRSSDGKVEKEGWELAIAVLGRMNDVKASQRKIAKLLDHIELTDEVRVNRVLTACGEQGLLDQVKALAERYADTIAESTKSYGPALIYYARAHATTKLKSTLALLTSICLLHSAALPAKNDMDPLLSSLLSKERSALVDLARIDSEAAEMLALHISGYATLRRFYELRDQAASCFQRSAVLLERRREAATALLVVTESAADCIQGGLFDPSVESVVPVDGLLVLFGESLPLLGHPQRIFTKSQVFALLRLVEDFTTAPGRIRDNAESLLKASLNAYRNVGGKMGQSDLLRKSKSDLSSKSGSGLGGSSYDMLASIPGLMMQSIDSVESGGSGKSSGNGDEQFEIVARGWDWRKGLDGFMDVGRNEVVILIRTALAKEVAKGWSGEINW